MGLQNFTDQHLPVSRTDHRAHRGGARRSSTPQTSPVAVETLADPGATLERCTHSPTRPRSAHRGEVAAHRRRSPVPGPAPTRHRVAAPGSMAATRSRAVPPGTAACSIWADGQIALRARAHGPTMTSEGSTGSPPAILPTSPAQRPCALGRPAAPGTAVSGLRRPARVLPDHQQGLSGLGRRRRLLHTLPRTPSRITSSPFRRIPPAVAGRNPSRSYRSYGKRSSCTAPATCRPRDREASVVVLEYAVHGLAGQQPARLDTLRLVITIKDRKSHWRDYARQPSLLRIRRRRLAPPHK